MKTKIISIAVLLLVCAGTLTTRGQETEPKEQLWYCWEAKIHPDMVDQFVGFISDQKAFFEETNNPLPYYVWENLNFHYYFFVRMNSYDDINQLSRGWGALIQKWGEEKVGKYLSTIEYSRTYFIRHKPDISYTPEKSRLTVNEAVYVIWDILYIIPGKEKEAFSLMHQFSGLIKNINFEDPIRVFAGDLGFEGSALIGVLQGESPEDFYTQNAKMFDQLGEEGEKIYNQMMKLLRKREQKELWYLKDISYEPVEK